jgi:hypothetical protein
LLRSVVSGSRVRRRLGIVTPRSPTASIVGGGRVIHLPSVGVRRLGNSTFVPGRVVQECPVGPVDSTVPEIHEVCG